MKKLWIMALTVILALAITGCQEEEPTTPGEALEKAQKADHPAEKADQPTAKVPKDHPAH
jgi:PBP1b-binding outer membrane lipoprotein LpoB